MFTQFINWFHVCLDKIQNNFFRINSQRDWIGKSRFNMTHKTHQFSPKKEHN